MKKKSYFGKRCNLKIDGNECDKSYFNPPRIKNFYIKKIILNFLLFNIKLFTNMVSL